MASRDHDRLSKALLAWQGIAAGHKLILIIVLLVLIVGAFWLFSFSKKSSATPLINVVLGNASSDNVPVYLNGLGAVTPLDSVTVKTQVNGQLVKVFFREGQDVKAGELVALIDERPFLAQFMQYQGQLLHDQALLENAKIDLQRYESLWKEDSTSKQILDTQVSLVRQLEGSVTSDQGLLNTARVNLEFCQIKSPINGRIGLRLVDPGNFVQTSDTTGLFVINTVQPMTVVFTLPEDNIPQVMKQIRTGKKLVVEAYDRTQNQLLATGYLLTIDNQIDASTGTVKLKAEFKNEEDNLFPNQFVNVKLRIDTLDQATVVPTTAIQYGTKKYIYAFDEKNNTVHIKEVAPGIPWGEYTVIKEGIKPGEKVVIQGTDKLVDGMKVRVSMLGPEGKK